MDQEPSGENLQDVQAHADTIYRDSDREYLSQGFLSTLSLAMITGGWAWGLVLIAVQGVIPQVSAWSPPILIMASGYACHRLHEEHLSLSAFLVIIGQIAALLAAMLVHQQLEFGYGMVLPILVSGVVAGRWGVGGAVAACAWILSVGGSRLGLPPAVMRVPLLVIVAAGGIAYMLAQYIHVALDLSGESRRRAMTEMRNAQARRAQLHRANRALDESNIRLQRLNRELLTTRREAEEARRLRQEFAANVSHELRTPINLIVGFSEMMVTAPESYGGEALPSGYWGDVQSIHRSARHLQGLIDDILDLSRIDAHRLELHRQELAADELVHEACQVVGELVERKGLNLRIQVASGLPNVYVDRTRIRQVLLNLISNAVRFTDTGGITVACRLANARDEMHAFDQDEGNGDGPDPVNDPAASFICFSVHDTGVGIMPSDLPKVFEKFRQLDGSTSRQHGGAGLGLPISKQFVELHGGRMWVESAPGKGSTFSFLLPLFDANWARPTTIDTGPLGDGATIKGTVLVVDSDSRSARLLQRHLPELRIVPADRSESIRRALMTHVPDLVLVSDGRDASCVWEGIAPDDPLRRAHVTVLVGHLRTERRFGQGGWRDYLLKPVQREQLIGAIRRLPDAVDHVLVVEDEPDMSRLISRLLRSWRDEIAVTRAYSVQEAQQRISSDEPDLILLDLGLPDAMGYDLLGWLRDERGSDVPVIVVTGDADTEMVEAVHMDSLVLAHEDGFRAQEFLGLVRVLAREFPSRYVPRQNQDDNDDDLHQEESAG